MLNTSTRLAEIKIAAINVNSIIANYRRLELLEFINKYNHDIILLSETKLNNKYKLLFTDYNIIRTDRPNSIQGGGTAIVIKKTYHTKQYITHVQLTIVF